MSSDRRDEGDDPGSVEDAFSVLGDETRLAILLELAEVVGERGFGEGLSFAELRERVGVKDSGRFNYHLDKLTDGFVTQEDGEYTVQFPGLAVVSALYSGVYGDPGETQRESVELDRTCQFCERTVELHYEGTEMWHECPEHGVYDAMPIVPPGAYVDRTLEELREVVYTRLLVGTMLARQEMCLQCWGTMEVDYPVQALGENPGGDEFIWTELTCSRCWNEITAPLRLVVGVHPLVLGPFHEQGLSMGETASRLTDISGESICETTLTDTEPPEATVSITVDDDEHLELTVDEDCTVVGFERDG